MAWDRIQIGIQLHSTIQLNGWKHFVKGKYEEHIEGYSLSHNGIDLLYFPCLYGQIVLKATLNLGRIFHGNNAASIWTCNLQDLHQRLNTLLEGIINLNKIGHIRYWMVYKYECFADFIIHEQDMNAWLQVISKCSMPYKTNDLTHFEDGTIYFHSGKSLAKSHSNVKIYDKLKQLRDTESKFNRPRIDYNNADYINLPLGYRILRIEIYHDRAPIRRHNKRVIIGESKNLIRSINYSDILNADEPIPEQCFYTFEELFRFKRQIQDINKVVSELNLNRPVTTTKKLIKAVESLEYTDTIIKNVISTLKYINNPRRYKAVNKERIRMHKKIILETGYHYITSTRELQALSIDADVIKMLPDTKQQMIRYYQNSNIFKDYFTKVL